jgi:F-type H+-transporting ATPase subunit delta
MAHFRVARRYARALLTLAEEQKKLERIGSDVEKIWALVRASRELELFLQNPTIMKDKKTRALREIFSKTVDSLTLHFLLLLVAKGREKILMPIIEQFRLLVDERDGHRSRRGELRGGVEQATGERAREATRRLYR